MTDPTISLEIFCHPDRPELVRPFSIDTWTYATNGHVLVRVPRRDDVAENETAPNVARMFPDDAPKARYKPAPKFEIPERFDREEECFGCGGTGKAHHHWCPDCQCVCDRCNGTGKATELVTVKIGRASFNSKYVSWLQQLPNLELDRVPRGFKPMRFRFDGGEGLLMPCRA